VHISLAQIKLVTGLKAADVTGLKAADVNHICILASQQIIP
jgi:hypothetical protein